MDVIAQILKYLKIELIENHLKHGGVPLEATDFDWVITVPAIWRARGKQMMREAGYKVTHTSLQGSILCMFPFQIMLLNLQIENICTLLLRENKL